MVRILGAPVTDADGNVAANTSASGAVERAVTEEVICQTLGYRSSVKSAGTWTDPTSATRPRSLRTMSTIITFSARSFGERPRSSRARRSSSIVRPRGAVPFIGRVRMQAPARSKNSSGDAEQMTRRPARTNAPCRPRWAAVRSAKKPSGSPSKRARSLNVKFTW